MRCDPGVIKIEGWVAEATFPKAVGDMLKTCSFCTRQTGLDHACFWLNLS